MPRKGARRIASGFGVGTLHSSNRQRAAVAAGPRQVLSGALDDRIKPPFIRRHVYGGLSDMDRNHGMDAGGARPPFQVPADTGTIVSEGRQRHGWARGAVRGSCTMTKEQITPTRIAWATDSARLLVFGWGAQNINLVSLTDHSVREMPVEGRVDMSWGADPRFAVVARPSLTATRSGLEWLDTRTGGLSPLISSESMLSYPSVSPDGSRVAYTVGETDFDLVEISLDGSPIRPLLASRLSEHSVHYSPRSNEFAYVAAGGGSEIRIRQPATLAERVVVSGSDSSDDPGPARFAAVAFSPDGTKLACNSNFTIWISPSNGGAPAKLTRESGEFAAEWSPDGAWIAFNYSRPFFGGLVKVRVGAGEAEVRLRSGGCGPVAPAWSPDGAWIACGREPMGLELVPADGGLPRSLGLQYEPVAAWSRDSQRLHVIRTWKDAVSSGN